MRGRTTLTRFLIKTSDVIIIQLLNDLPAPWVVSATRESILSDTELIESEFSRAVRQLHLLGIIEELSDGQLYLTKYGRKCCKALFA